MGSLRLKRGDSTDRLNYTPLEGELILDTDTQQLFIGDGVTAGGNAVVAGNANVTIVSNYSNANVAAFLPTFTGNIQCDVLTANSITGAVFSSLPAANLIGTIPGGVLGNSTTYVGTTAIALNRSSANIELTGIDKINTDNNDGSRIQFNGNAVIPASSGTPGESGIRNANYTAIGGYEVSGTYLPQLMASKLRTNIKTLYVQELMYGYGGQVLGITSYDHANGYNGAAVINSIKANSTLGNSSLSESNGHSIFTALTAGNMCVTGNLDVLGTIDVGTMSANSASIVGNINGNNLQITHNIQSATANISGNLTAGNLVTGGQVVATGNVLGDYFVGNAINLTGNIAASSFIGQNLDLTGNADIDGYATVTGNLNTANIVNAGGNIKLIAGGAVMLDTSNAGVTLGGNVTISSGGTGYNNLIVAGNVTGNVFSGNGSGLSNLTGANVTGTVPSANVADYVQLVPTNTTAATHYINFTNSATANSQLRTDTDLTWNPNTNTLSAPAITGNLTGTASKANIARMSGEYSPNAYTFITSLTRNASGNLNSTQATDTFGVTQDLMTLDWYVGPNANTGFNTEAYGNLRVKGNLTVFGTGSNANGFVGGNFVSNTITTKDLTVTGNIGGSFSTNSVAVTNTASSTSHYIPFITGNTSGTYSLYNDAGIRYVPSNNSFNIDGNINAVQGFYSGNITTSGGLFGSPQSTKANNSTGTAGQIAWDANYIYVCTSTNVWKRVALTTF